MTKRSRWGKLAPAAAATVVVLLLASPSTSPFGASGQSVAAQGNGQSNDNCVIPSNNKGNCLGTFGVSVGSINPIFPGQSRALPVTVSNPNSFDILIVEYTATVKVPGGTPAACSPSSLVVPSGRVMLAPRLPVAPRGNASMTVPVRLPASAPDACQRVAFSISVTATAVKK